LRYGNWRFDLCDHSLLSGNFNEEKNTVWNKKSYQDHP
jgi:hypothetical protein